MAVDGSLLQGQIIEDSEAETKNVESLLVGFLKALLAEQTQAGERT